MSIPESARHKYFDERAEVFNPKDPTSRQFFITPDIQADYYYNQENLYSDIIDEEVRKTLPDDQPVTDILVFQKHLEILKSNTEIWQSNVSILLPRGYSLETFLKIDQEFTEGWKQPELHEEVIPKGFSTTEVSIPHFNRNHFEETIADFDAIVKMARHTLFNVTPLPFTVETVDIPRSQYRYLVKQRHTGETVNFFTETDSNSADCVKIATRLVIGGGRNNAIVIKLGLSEILDDKTDNETRFYYFEYSAFPKEVLDFLKQLPPLYTVNANAQINYLQGLLTDLYDTDLKLNVFDLSSLAIANGCRMDNYSLYSLSALVTGKPFPTGIESMDQSWAKDSDQLDVTAKKYLRYKLQLMYDVFSVLMGAFFRNLFPDVDIVLDVTELSQSAFTAWFSEFVGLSLSNAKIVDVQTEITRSDMLLKIGYPRSLFGILADLIPNVPVINCGGARFIHHARYSFIFQYPALTRIKLHDYSGEVPNLCKNLDGESFKLMFKREFVNDSGHAVRRLGFQASPSCTNSLFDIDLETDHVTIDKPAHAIKEWGRLNVDCIPELFDKLRNMTTDDISKFWFPKISIYVYLSNVYFNVKNIRITVPILEQSLIRRKQNVEVHYNNDLLKAMRVLEKRKQRLDVLQHNIQAPGPSQRHGVHQRVQLVVPGDSTQKNKLKSAAKKRRLARAKETKFRNGLAWISCKKKKMITRLNSVKENDSPEPNQNTAIGNDVYADKLDSKDARHVLRRLNSQ